MRQIQEIEDKYSINLFAKRGITLVRGKGALLWDDTGKEYIDCAAGHGVASIGHSNPHVVEAITRQAGQLITCTGSFYNEQRAMLMEKLVKISPKSLTRAFLCNSGTESIEAALKFARISTGKTDFVVAMRGFHGRTMGALSATFDSNYKKDFEPLIPGFHTAPFNNFEKLKEKVNENTAAVLLEVVQGEGGVHSGTKEYFKQVQALCKKENVLLIIDEVQTGFARTGKLFACEYFDIKPDILCLAKAMAGGIPIGAVLCSDKIKVAPGKHGSTFGGNPLACAASLAAIDFIIEQDLAGQSEEKGTYFVRGFEKHQLDKVREVRQIGLMIAIELKEKSGPYIQALQDEGVIAIPAGATVIRLLPPLTISHRELDIVIAKLAEVLKDS